MTACAVYGFWIYCNKLSQIAWFKEQKLTFSPFKSQRPKSQRWQGFLLHRL